MAKIRNNKTILVAGGAGFLGSHLCEKLCKNKDDHIICIDNLYTSSKENIIHLEHLKNFEMIRCDVEDELKIFADEIYNFACPASPIHYQKNPVKTIKTSILGSINLLELAQINNAKIFQASTSEVYGDPSMHPQLETYFGNVNPIGIRSCYDEGKRCSETLFFDYWRQYNLQIKVGRIFNTYGPRMHPKDGRVVSNFIVQALMNKPITIYGSGEQTRSFCYVDDLIEIIIRIMNSPPDVTGPFNIGNPQEIRIIDLANAIIKLVGSKSKIILKELPSDDPQKRKPDITRVKEEFGWAPSTSLLDGLSSTIEYFTKLLNNE